MPGLSQHDFIELYDAYHAGLYRFLLLRVGRVETAQDLTSETFLKAWKALSIRGVVAHPQAYLYRIATTTLADYYRKHGKEVFVDDEFLAKNLDNVAKNATINDFADPVELARVYRALSQLPDDYATVITLRYVEDLPHGEIATAMGKSEGAVRVLLTRALKALREHLESSQKV